MMSAKRALFLAFVLGTAQYTSPSVARAVGFDLTVVRITPTAVGFDSKGLRSALEMELHSVLIEPSDARSSSAKGTLTIDLDPRHEELAVTYLANAKPLTRKVSLPTEKNTAERTIVLLAGNLARDEGGDLAAELRKRPGSDAGTRGESPETRPANLALGSADLERERERDASRLQATLDYYADSDRRTRRAVGYALAAAGAAAAGVTVYAGARSKDARIWLTGGIGTTLLLGLGVGALVDSAPFQYLAEHGHSVGKRSAQDTEQTWARMAAREHRARRTSGIIGLVASGVTVGLSTWVLLDGRSAPDNRSPNYALALPCMGLGMVEGVLSVYALASEGQVESALHGYEQSSGRTLGLPSAILPHFQVGMTSSGLFAAMSGTF